MARSLLRFAVLLFLGLFLTAHGRTIPPRAAALPVKSNILSQKMSTKPVQIQAQTRGTYPRVAALGDGTMLMGYTSIEGPERSLHVLRSTDKGKSFQPFSTIASHDGDMDNVFLLEVPGSNPPRILAAYRNNDWDADKVYTAFRITVAASEDGGQTWKFLSEPTSFSAASSHGMGVWEPFLRVGADGALQITWSQELERDNQETFRSISKDGGKTWSNPVNLRVHSPQDHWRDGMQGIVSVKDSDGRDALVMVFESNPRPPTFHIEYAVSYDDGATYEKRGVVFEPPKGHNAGDPQVGTIHDKGVIVVFSTDEDSDEIHWPGNAKVKACVSPGLRDGKLDFGPDVDLAGENSIWAGSFDMKNGDVMVTYDHNGNVEGQLLSWS